MKIETSYTVRDKTITSSYSIPLNDMAEILKVLGRELRFPRENFKITITDE